MFYHEMYNKPFTILFDGLAPVIQQEETHRLLISPILHRKNAHLASSNGPSCIWLSPCPATAVKRGRTCHGRTATVGMARFYWINIGLYIHE